MLSDSYEMLSSEEIYDQCLFCFERALFDAVDYALHPALERYYQ
jgi:hypothetical protein